MSTLIEVAKKLTVSERILLVEDVWDSIARESSVAREPMNLSKIELAELKRRITAHQADPSSAIPWKDVQSKLFQGKS